MRNIFRGKKKTKSLNPNQLKKIENVFGISKTSKISYNTLPQPQTSVIREKLAILRSHLRKAKPPRQSLGEKLKNFKNLAINIRLAYLRFKLKNPKVLPNRISCICKKCGLLVSKLNLECKGFVRGMKGKVIFKKALALATIVAVIVTAYWQNIPPVEATTYTWLQTDWSSGASGTGRTHAQELSSPGGWYFYNNNPAKDANLSATTSLTLTTTPGTPVTQTYNSNATGGFNLTGNTKSNVEVLPSGTGGENASVKLGTSFVCGNSFTVDHTAGSVAPATKTVSYGTVSTNLTGASDKCWITQNLGADHQASSATDNTETAAGWYWQFNRKQGYKHDGTTLTPSWAGSPIIEDSNWTSANDPITLATPPPQVTLPSSLPKEKKTSFRLSSVIFKTYSVGRSFDTGLKLHYNYQVTPVRISSGNKSSEA